MSLDERVWWSDGALAEVGASVPALQASFLSHFLSPANGQYCLLIYFTYLALGREPLPPLLAFWSDFHQPHSHSASAEVDSGISRVAVRFRSLQESSFRKCVTKTSDRSLLSLFLSVVR